MPAADLAGVGRDERVGEAEAGRLGEPALDAGDPADLAGQAHLADRDEVGGQRRSSRAALARASATARSAAGSVSFTPPTVAV